MTGLPRTMSALHRHAVRFLADEHGGTAIEYALVASGIGAAVAGTIWNLGTEIRTTFYNKLTTIMN